MKYAFISDIHGNAVALEAVLDDIKKQAVDKIVVLGDLCYRGPEPKKSIDLVRSLNTEVIKGNADEWIIRGVQSGEVPDSALDVMNRERDWALSRLEASDIDYLASLPTSHFYKTGEINIHVFHATPNSLFEIIQPQAENDLMEKTLMVEDAQIFVYGHIHIPFIRYLKGKVIINTGSVGLPFDGLPKAAYAIVDVESDRIQTSIERVEYNKDTVINLYNEVNYPNSEMMINIIKNGGK